MFVSPDDVGVHMKSLPKDTKILASSSKQGILCCERETKIGSEGTQCRYFAYVPLTGQLRDIPDPKTKTRNEKTIFITLMVTSAQPLRFKIIRLSGYGFIRRYNELYKYGCEVFDSETWTWKKKSGHILLPFRGMIARNSAISTANFVHWLTTENKILSYDSTNNTFRKFLLPKNVRDNLNSYKIKKFIKYEGKLGFVCMTERRVMDLWVMNDVKNQTWKKVTSANLETLERVTNYPSPLGFYNAHVAFVEGGFNEVGFYKMRDSSFNSVKLGRLNHADDVFRFRYRARLF